MLLGKRPRPAIRRTTSMTGITAEETVAMEEYEPLDGPAAAVEEDAIMAVHHADQRLLTSLVSPRNLRRNVSSESFLRTCGLCRRRLAHGRDIYMYRGDTPFCSLECREKQMKKDQRREKNGTVSSKKDAVDRASASFSLGLYLKK